MRYFRWKLHHPESFPLLCQEKQLQSYFQYFICYLGAIQTQRSQLEYQVELSLDSRPSLSGQQLSHWLAAHLQFFSLLASFFSLLAFSNSECNCEI